MNKQDSPKPRSLSRALRFWAAGLLLVCGLAPLSPEAATLRLGKGGPPVALKPNNPALALQNAFIEVASTVSPAVVNISSEWTENVRGFGGFGDMDQFFNWFYGQRGQMPTPMYKQKQRSLGSGFLITSDGYILTNAHVVGKAEKVTVTFENGTTYPAKIIGKDERVDIAVVKINGEGKAFPHVELGDSEDIKVGEWAIAIGNPFALDHTVTAGVISAKGRSINMSDQGGGLESYIQTDASINPGNSGGPLCNIQGEVIGINSAIYSQSGGSVGIGFAIPSNIARKAAEDLVNEGKIIRAGLGAVVQGLSPQMARSFGLTTTEGALLSSINPGSAADKAGLKPGDIVLALNGDRVTGAGDLVSKLLTLKPGDRVDLTILRNGSQSKVSVTLQELSEKAASAKPSGNDEGDDNNGSFRGQSNSLGFFFQDQTPEIKEQLPRGAPKGPVVTQVSPQSPAAAAGLQPGDVILKAGDSILYSAGQLATVLKKSDLKSGLRLFLWRNGETLYAFLQTGDE